MKVWTFALAVGLIFAGSAAPGPVSAAPSGPSAATVRPACAPAHGRVASCFARYRTAATGGPRAALDSGPSGLTPAQIQSAYNLSTSGGATQTVAIVDAFDNPNAESDLAVFRAQFGLPACTTANGCFQKVNQRGDPAPLPAANLGWGVEIALDLQAVSTTCPLCHILLVEGDSPTIDSLGIAENTAVALHADVVSNSYGANEFTGVNDVADKYYTHPGVPIVASTGDSGFSLPGFPASAPSTIAVGGTTLTQAPGTSRGWTESVWEGAGSGCSAYFDKPAWQADPNCPMRTVGDVAAVADPATGLSVYDTYGLSGWLVVGGTSLAAPLIAGIIATADGPAPTNASIYAHRSALYDVVGGSNAGDMDCGGDYLCTGLPGYDAPTGLGTPNGNTAF